MQQGHSVGLVTKEKFSELSGAPIEVVNGWVEKRYLPVVRIGKRVMINVVVLQQQLGEQEFFMEGVG